jgi:hypothetical protein
MTYFLLGGSILLYGFVLWHQTQKDGGQGLWLTLLVLLIALCSAEFIWESAAFMARGLR